VLLGDSIILEKSVLEEKKKQEYLGVGKQRETIIHREGEEVTNKQNVE